MHIAAVKSGGKTYYYARKNDRVNGEPKTVWSLSLGTAEDIVKVYQNRRLSHLKFQTFEFGKISALHTIAEELDFFNIVDNIVGKKDVGGLTPSQYLFLIISGRTSGPKSKTETGKWFHNTFLEMTWTPEHDLSCQNFLNHMDYLTDDKIQNIEIELGKKMISLGLTPKILFWDTSNYSTCIESWDADRIPQSGYPKDKRFDRNLVGMGLAVSDHNIPIAHETFPGNEHDSTVFTRMIETMVKRLELLKVKAHDVVMVFDQGGNSPENIDKVLEKMHIVGSLKRNQVEDLIMLPNESFSFLHKTRNGGNVYAYRTKREFWGRDFTVVVTYTEKTAERKRRTWLKAREKILAGMDELAKKYAKIEGKGRKMTLKGLTQRIHDLVNKQYRAMVTWEIDQKNRVLTWRIDEEKEEQYLQRSGKTALFTDMHSWGTKRIVNTYHSKTAIEDDFRWMHGKLGIPVPPFYVRLDRRIRVHSFLCVLGLVFLRYLAYKLSSLRASPQKIWSELERLRVVLVKDVMTDESQFFVEEMNSIQAKAFGKLGLAKYLPLN